MAKFPDDRSMNFNLAVESLKRALNRDKLGKNLVGHIKVNAENVRQDVEISESRAESNLGLHTNTDA
tara:strand:- start:185 stop:385 length:201 start_codon:yes stop_codon:yes gene_type:complete